MFELEKFYEKAHKGEAVNEEELKNYLLSFDRLILWGAGNLGTAVGEKIKEWGILNIQYWDARAGEIKEKNGYPVLPPFGEEKEKNTVLVIFCIANVAVGPTLFSRLLSEGWPHIMKGTAFLEGVLCPFSVTKELDTAVCNSSPICSVCSCERLDNLMKRKVSIQKKIETDQFFSMDRIHFIINNFCNLKCTHCFMYMNSYEAKRKRNVQKERMERDIHMLLSAVDSFGVVNMFGGEPFLHPDLGEITSFILKHNNFGSLIINTNGMAHIKKSQVEPLTDPRVRLAFSNYLGSIDQEKERVFNENIEMFKDVGITVLVNNQMPTWNISSTLSNNHIPDQEKMKKKEQCGVRFLYVHNGKVFPCSFCFSIYDLGIADYPEDYVDIDECGSGDQLRIQLKKMLERPFYEACGHCDECKKTAGMAGEQGWDKRYCLPEEE